MNLTLKGDQPAALDAAMAWFNTPANRRKQVFRIDGGAGVGKTTVAQRFGDFCKVHYMTLGGKAALVMRKKGCEGASTIHSSIYTPVDGEGEKVYFDLNYDSEAIRDADLLVVDELGMVDSELGADLVSFGKPILALGDLNQLPPPSDKPAYFLQGEADFTMREILRQAKDSPIIELAYQALESGKLKPGKYGDSTVFSDKVKSDVVKARMLEANQVLCGKNATRAYNNDLIRRWRGLEGMADPRLPLEGERLVCLRNDRKKGVLNGEQFTVKRFLESDLGKIVSMEVESLDSGSNYPVQVDVPWNYFFGTEGQMPAYERKNFDQFVYAYVMTCHKFQGSQADYVTVLDESRAFREYRRNWLYTAITRAAEKVDIFL